MSDFTRGAMRRVARSVQWTEEVARNRPLPRGGRRGPVVPAPQFVRVDGDIEHNEVGTCHFLETATDYTDDAKTIEGNLQYDCYNPLPKVWENAEAIAQPVALVSAESSILCLTQAFSATRIRGNATEDISPGETAGIDSVIGLDGHYDLTTADVYLPTTYVSVSNGLAVWAELVWNESTGISRWEVYSADCIEA